MLRHIECGLISTCRGVLTLERAATAEQKAHTWIYCTYAWYNCGWPQQFSDLRQLGDSIRVILRIGPASEATPR